MSDNTTIISPLKQALISVEKMQRRIEELENEQKEPIAVIGMGCRFNACSNVDEYS